MTMARTVKLYRLPTEPKTPGFREMRPEDSEHVVDILNKYLERFQLAPVFTQEEVQYWYVAQETCS